MVYESCRLQCSDSFTHPATSGRAHGSCSSSSVRTVDNRHKIVEMFIVIPKYQNQCTYSWHQTVNLFSHHRDQQFNSCPEPKVKMCCNKVFETLFLCRSTAPPILKMINNVKKSKIVKTLFFVISTNPPSDYSVPSTVCIKYIDKKKTDVRIASQRSVLKDIKHRV